MPYSQELTVWIDILFTKQYGGRAESVDSSKFFNSTLKVYSTCNFHLVVLHPSLLRRAWCLLELAVSTTCSREVHTAGELTQLRDSLDGSFYSRMEAKNEDDIAMIKSFIKKHFKHRSKFDTVVARVIHSFRNSAEAACLEGRRYELGIGVPKNLVKARKRYQLAADEGNARAQANLGVFYDRGLGGLDKDPVKAVELFNLAAEQSYAGGLYNLGSCYEAGRSGLRQNEKAASRCFLAAAQQRHLEALVAVGEYYENGRGIFPRDEVQAARFYYQAAEQGSRAAESKLTSLLRRAQAER
jgi:TPR repeat protein